MCNFGFQPEALNRAFLDIFEELLVLQNFFLEYRCDFFTPLTHHCSTQLHTATHTCKHILQHTLSETHVYSHIHCNMQITLWLQEL